MRALADSFGAGYFSSGLEDVHVHTSACDDADQSARSALVDARARGLTMVCFTAHVRQSTPGAHVDSYLETARAAALEFPEIDVRYSVEAKIMNTDGELDVPEGFDLTKLDAIHSSDHRFPLDEPLAPQDVALMLAEGQVSETELWDALLEATCNSVERYNGVIVAHPLSIIPKIGLRPQDVPAGFGETLAAKVLRHGAVVEINNKWQCPSVELIDALHTQGAPIVAASDSHHAGETGGIQYLENIRSTVDPG